MGNDSKYEFVAGEPKGPVQCGNTQNLDYVLSLIDSEQEYTFGLKEKLFMQWKNK